MAQSRYVTRDELSNILPIIVSGTTYTLSVDDVGRTLEFTNGSAVTLTVPTQANARIPVGSVIELYQYGAGQVTVSPASGVTIRSPGTRLKLGAQYAGAYLRKRATDEWILEGDITT